MRRWTAFGMVGLALAAGAGGAWSVSSRPAEARIATIDVFGLVERISDLPEFAGLRDERVDFYTREIEARNTRMGELRNEAAGKTPEEQMPLHNEFVRLQGELTSMQSEAQQELERLSAEHFAEALKRVRAAANTAAADLGYSHVIGSRPFDTEINTDATGLFLQELVLRSVVVSPATDDITAYVADTVLKLPPPVLDAMPEPATEPAPATSDPSTTTNSGGR